MKILQSPNIGMWGVYPETMDWNFGAMCSDFKFGERRAPADREASIKDSGFTRTGLGVTVLCLHTAS
jgi:hypothetical protein